MYVEVWVNASYPATFASLDPQMMWGFLTAKNLQGHLNSLYAEDECEADPDGVIKYWAL